MRELTPEVAAALERLLRVQNGEYAHKVYGCVELPSFSKAKYTQDVGDVLDFIDNLYPPGHAEPITPERLMACGGRVDKDRIFWKIPNTMIGEVWCMADSARWYKRGRYMDEEDSPSNMGEVWELLDRLGIDRLGIDWRNKKGKDGE